VDETVGMEKMDKIEQLLSDLRVEVAESRVNLEHILEHLAKINGRTGKNEEKVVALEAEVGKVKTVWATISFISSLLSSAATWVYHEFSKK
jgi:hypothetical protein